jgi:hypothetical protein
VDVVFGGGWLVVEAVGSGCASLAFVLRLDFLLDSLAVAAVPPLTDTSGVIFLIVAAEMPAFDKSSMEE